jgi:hypothetical protein
LSTLNPVSKEINKCLLNGKKTSLAGMQDHAPGTLKGSTIAS